MLPSEPHDDEPFFTGSLSAAAGEPIEEALEREQRWSELVARFHDRHLNDTAAAEKALALALELQPAEPSVVRGLVDLAARREDWTGAAQRLAAAAERATQPDDRARLHLEAASLLETKVGDSEGAVAHYRRALAASPG